MNSLVLWILPALGWLIGASLLYQVLGLPLFEVRVRRLASGKRPPDSMVDLVAGRGRELEELGFEGPRLASLEDLHGSESSQRFQAAWVHPHQGVIVYLLPPEDIQDPNRLNTLFVSRLKSGRLLVSQVYDPFFAAASNDHVRGQTVVGDTLTDQFNHHMLWANAQDEPVDRGLGGSRLVDELLAGALNQQRQDLLRRGQLIEGADGVARPGLRFGLRLLLTWLRRPRPPATDSDLPIERLLLMDRVLDRARGYAPAESMQWLLFGGSVAAFLVLGSVVFGLLFAVLLALVIAIHELGHFLAMRAFGYRQVRMMLLPMIGGVTIGHEEKPDPVRRGWVSLMGPLPGIVLGAILLWLVHTPGFDWEALYWLHTLAWLLLIVNYFNLLPVPPLDGGRIVEDLLPARWAWLRVLVVLVLCGAGIAVSLLTGFWALVVIIALPLLTLPGFLTAARAARQIDGSALVRAPRSARMRAALRALEQVAGPTRQAAQRIGQAEEVLRIVRFEPVGLGRQVTLGSTYVLVLLAPLGSSAAAMVLWFGLVADHDYATAGENEFQAALEAELAPLSIDALLEQHLAHEGANTAPSPATSASLANAESRLGLALPEDLRRIYARGNGLPSLGIRPVQKLEQGATCLAPFREAFEAFREEFGFNLNVIYVDGREQELALERLADWICLRVPESESQLLIAPDQATGLPAGQRMLGVSEYGMDSWTDLETWLREQVMMERLGQWYAEDYQRRGAALEHELAGASTLELIERMPKTGFLERRAMGWPSLPRPARASAVEAAEQRLGLSLPDSLRELYTIHDGYYPWTIQPVAELAWFSSWPAAQESLPWPWRDQDDWMVSAPDQSQTLMVDRDDLDACLVIGKPLVGFMKNMNEVTPASLLWCPNLAGGVVIDLPGQSLFENLPSLFNHKTRQRLLIETS